MENGNNYPDLKSSVFLLIYYQLIAFLPVLVTVMISQISGMPRNHPIFTGISSIITLAFTLRWLNKKGRLNINKDMFFIKNFSVLRFIIITITTFGLMLCLRKVNEIVLSFSPVLDLFNEIMPKVSLKDASTILVWGFISMAIIAPIVEEILFRGIILRGFLSNYSEKKAILLSALIFGVIHFNIWQFFNAFFLGIFLGWLFSKTKSISTCIWVHGLNNAVSLITVYKIMKNANIAAVSVKSQPIYLVLIGLIIFILGILWLRRSFGNSKSVSADC